MKVWLTKYALSSGIEVVEDARIENGRVYPGGKYFSFTVFHLGDDAHDTEVAAIADAEKRRLKKLGSLHKQIAKLERMEFKV